MMRYDPSKPIGEFLADLAMGFFQAVEGGDMPPVVLDVRAGKYVAELGVVLRSIRLYQPEDKVGNKLKFDTVEEICDAVGKTFRFPGGKMTITGAKALKKGPLFTSGHILFDYTMDNGLSGQQQAGLSIFREWFLEECESDDNSQ